MGVKFNNNDIADIKVGTSQIESVYLGSDLVWTSCDKELWSGKCFKMDNDEFELYNAYDSTGDSNNRRYVLFKFKCNIIEGETLLDRRDNTVKQVYKYNICGYYSTQTLAKYKKWQCDDFEFISRAPAFNAIISIDTFKFGDTLPFQTATRFIFYSPNSGFNLRSLDWSIFKNNKFEQVYGLCAINLDDETYDLTGIVNSNCKGINEMFRDSHIPTTNKKIVICNDWDTSNCTRLDRPFYNFAKEIRGYENWDTSKATTLSALFLGMYDMTSIDIHNFNTNKVTTVYQLFLNCTKVETINLQGCDFSKCTIMSNMFSGCINLESIGTGTVILDLTSTTNAHNMFYNCHKLTSNIKLVGGSNNTYTSGMFSNCSQLTNIDTSDFTITDKCTSISSMFQDCKLNSNFEFVLSGKDLSGMTDMSSLFSRRELPTIKKCDLSNNTWREEGVNCNFMFRWGGCEYVDFRGLKPNSMTMCFYQAVYKTIDLRGCDTSLCTNMTTNFSIINTPAEHFYIDSNYFNTNIAVIPLGGILGTNIESITSVLNSLIDHPKTKLENWDSEDDYDNWLYSQTLQIQQSTFDFIQNNETLKALFDEATNVGWEISS